MPDRGEVAERPTPIAPPAATAASGHRPTSGAKRAKDGPPDVYIYNSCGCDVSLLEDTMATSAYSANLSNHSAANYNKHADFVYGAAATSPVLGLLQAKAGDRIADFGCGSGELTKQLVELVGTQGFVFGIDSSQSMVR
jgi:SAM-dependent methyltransferase